MSEGCKWHRNRLRSKKWGVPPFELQETSDEPAPKSIEGVEFAPTYDGQTWLLLHVYNVNEVVHRDIVRGKPRDRCNMCDNERLLEISVERQRLLNFATNTITQICKDEITFRPRK